MVMKNISDATYRVSVKAVIRDQAGRVLLMKEHDDYWSLPGGGMDYGESVEQALSRELHEELAVDTVTSLKSLGIDTYYSERAQIWRMWLLYEVGIGSFDVVRAVDGAEAVFMDIAELAGATHHREQRIYRLISAMCTSK